MKKLLVIIDMVNGFVNSGALADHKINKITPNIIKHIKMAIKNNIPIIAFKDSHNVNDEEFKVFPPHCIKGTSESELIPELKQYEKHFTIIEKNTTNGFNTKEFLTLAKKVTFDQVVVTGCCTDICVEQFVNAYSEFNKLNKRSTQIVIPVNAVYTFDGVNHNAVQCHKAALNRMMQIGAKITKGEDNEQSQIVKD